MPFLHRSRFEPHELPRTTVTLTPEARAALNAASAEGRIFAQALSEHFGALPQVAEVRVHCVPRSTHYEVTEADRHPVTGAEGRILEVEVVSAKAPYRFHLNVAQIEEIHADPQMGFRAARTAEELVRLYQLATGEPA